MEITASSLPEYDLTSEATWEEVEAFLRPYAKAWVARAGIPSWRGQEDDIVEEVVQETIFRVLHRMRLGERGDADPISSLEHLAVIILRNYVKDLMRRDRRVLHVFTEDYLSEISSVEGVDYKEEVIEAVTEEELFREVADTIARFPPKMRKALLIDIANRMDFDDVQTPLQRAFREAGVQLEDYRVSPPEDRVERARHASLASIGYKRLGQYMRPARGKYIP